MITVHENRYLAQRRQIADIITHMNVTMLPFAEEKTIERYIGVFQHAAAVKQRVVGSAPLSSLIPITDNSHSEA